MRLAYVLVLMLGCPVTQAACEIEPGHYGQKLSDSAAKARDTFYESECIRAGGTLVDSTDPTLKGRLELPSRILAPSSEPYGRLGIHLGITKSPELAYILDASGSVQNVAVIATSGNKQYDAAIVEFLHRIKWKQPAKLDGLPIPVLAYFRYQIKLSARPESTRALSTMPKAQ